MAILRLVQITNMLIYHQK